MPPKKVTPRGKAAAAPKASPRATGKKPPKTPTKKRGSTKRYIRAIYSPAGGTRITLTNGSRYVLQPRGQVNDLAPVTKDDMEDPNYVANKDVLFEEITAAEAKKITEKQATNAQTTRRSSVMDHLTNEKGEKYTQAPIVEKAFEQQGTTVAHVEDGPAGRFTDGHQGLITRAEGGMAPNQEQVPGSVGHPANIQVPADIPPEQVADWIARNQPKSEAAQGDLGLRAQITAPEREAD